MSIKVMSAVWDSESLSHTEKLVHLALADAANDAGVCWPTIATLAAKCQLSEQGVLNQIASLEKAAKLTVKRSHRRSNCYTLVTNLAPTPLTLPGGVKEPCPNAVDPIGSTPLGQLLNAVDPNRKEPSVKPSTKAGRVVFPEGLKSEAFGELWSEWRDHRKALRHPMTPQHEARELKRLAGWGSAKAIAAVTQSLEKGWRGIFEPEAKPTGQTVTAPAVPAWRRLRDLQDEEAKLTAALPTVFDRERHPDKVKRLAVVKQEIRSLQGGAQ